MKKPKFQVGDLVKPSKALAEAFIRYRKSNHFVSSRWAWLWSCRSFQGHRTWWATAFQGHTTWSCTTTGTIIATEQELTTITAENPQKAETEEWQT